MWRRGRDSNPRYGYPYAAFRVRCFQPLSHLSAGLKNAASRAALIYLTRARETRCAGKSKRIIRAFDGPHAEEPAQRASRRMAAVGRSPHERQRNAGFTERKTPGYRSAHPGYACSKDDPGNVGNARVRASRLARTSSGEHLSMTE